MYIRIGNYRKSLEYNFRKSEHRNEWNSWYYTDIKENEKNKKALVSFCLRNYARRSFVQATRAHFESKSIRNETFWTIIDTFCEEQSWNPASAINNG